MVVIRRRYFVGSVCVPALYLTVSTCGGRSSDHGGAADASGDGAWNADGVADTADGDAGGPPPPFIVVDGGTNCDAARPAPCCRETRTCCNGAVCEGMCVVFPDASAPICYCAGLGGGCPSPSVCCLYEGPHGVCTSGCLKPGPP